MEMRCYRKGNVWGALACGLLWREVAWVAFPTSVVYQGSLKQSGTPVNATASIEFRITNSDGSQLYWTSGAQSVQVKDGLYRVELSPTGINWSTIDPYIEMRVSG